MVVGAVGAVVIGHGPVDRSGMPNGRVCLCRGSNVHAQMPEKADSGVMMATMGAEA